MRQLLVLTALAALTPAQSPTPAPAATTYTSAAPVYTFSYPANLLPRAELAAGIARAMTADDSDPDHAKFVKCISFPIAAGRGAEQPHPDEFGMIFVLQLDHKCLGKPGPPEFREQLAQQLMQFLKAFGRPLTEDAKTYDLDGHPAAFVQGSVAAKALGQDTIVHAASTCALIDQSTVCWLLADSSHKRMPRLVAAPISIGGRPAVPLIPADLLQPW